MREDDVFVIENEKKYITRTVNHVHSTDYPKTPRGTIRSRNLYLVYFPIHDVIQDSEIELRINCINITNKKKYQ